jgi:hypothetical protein
MFSAMVKENKMKIGRDWIGGEVNKTEQLEDDVCVRAKNNYLRMVICVAEAGNDFPFPKKIWLFALEQLQQKF